MCALFLEGIGRKFVGRFNSKLKAPSGVSNRENNNRVNQKIGESKMNGKEFEAVILKEFRNDGWKIEKNQEGGMGRGGFVPFRNPFLDFTAARRGNVIMIEAKVVKGERIGIGKSGITNHQMKCITEWEANGIPTVVIVGFNGGVDSRDRKVFDGVGLIRHSLAGNKSVRIDDEEAIRDLTAKEMEFSGLKVIEGGKGKAK